VGSKLTAEDHQRLSWILPETDNAGATGMGFFKNLLNTGISKQQYVHLMDEYDMTLQLQDAFDIF
jgi:hypothetical protein